MKKPLVAGWNLVAGWKLVAGCLTSDHRAAALLTKELHRRSLTRDAEDLGDGKRQQ